MIWSSIDQSVQQGLNKALTAKADARASRSTGKKVEHINQLIMTKNQTIVTPINAS